jgi:hypothetical protein
MKTLIGLLRSKYSSGGASSLCEAAEAFEASLLLPASRCCLPTLRRLRRVMGAGLGEASSVPLEEAAAAAAAAAACCLTERLLKGGCASSGGHCGGCGRGRACWIVIIPDGITLDAT